MENSKAGKIAGIVLLPVGLLSAGYMLASSLVLLQDWTRHLNTHLALALLVIFLVAIKVNPRRWLIWLVFILATIACTCYVHVLKEQIDVRQLWHTPDDIFIGGLLILVCLTAAWLAFGKVFLILSLVFLLYAFFGSLLPPPFTAFPLRAEDVLSKLSIGLSTGIYGFMLETSARFIFLFLLFGGVLMASGITKDFMVVAQWVGAKFRGGPAQCVVVGDIFVGMVTGSAMANVGITGVLTIPMMKKNAYSAEEAAAWEATSSAGGQVIPPVMGAAAFLMASILGITYLSVCKAAIIPSFLYVAGLFVLAELRARRLNRGWTAIEKISGRQALLSLITLSIPIGTLIYLLTVRIDPSQAAFGAIIASLVIWLAKCAMARRRPDLRQMADGFVSGVTSGSQIAVICACLGIVTATMIYTGLGILLPAAIESFSGGHLWAILLLSAVVAIILGCFVTTTVVYILVALFICPVLVKFGFTPLQAHFFPFFVAVFSSVTYPVAPATLAAVAIAQASYSRAAAYSTLFAIVPMSIAVMIAGTPAVLLQNLQGFGSALELISCLIGVSLVAVTVGGYFVGPLTWWERIISGMSAACFISWFFLDWEVLVVGLCLIGVLLIAGFTKTRILAKTSALHLEKEQP